MGKPCSYLERSADSRDIKHAYSEPLPQLRPLVVWLSHWAQEQEVAGFFSISTSITLIDTRRFAGVECSHLF